MSYKSEYWLRANYQGLGAGANNGPGGNNPSTLFGLPLDPTLTSAPPNGYVLTYDAVQGYWTAKLGGGASFANPTATASDVAVNGVATTAMRSDAAPAIQKATASQFGIIKPDGTTITISTGIISIPSSVALPGNPTTTTPSSSDNSTKIATTAFVQNVTTGGFVPTGAAFHPGFVSGQFYFGPDALSAGSLAGNVSTAAATLYAIPFFVPVATTFNTIGIHCTTGVAASSIQLGVYNNSGGLPSSLVKDCGNVATTTSGTDVTIGSLNMTLSPGWYWIALGSDATHTPGFSCVVGSTSICSSIWFLGSSTSAPSSSSNNIKTTWTPGALPNTFPTGSLSYGNGSWLIFLKT